MVAKTSHAFPVLLTPCLVAWQLYKPVAVKQGINQREKERW